MTTREEFGKRIVAKRAEKDLSQEQLAERAGITQNNMSRIERGLYSPGLDILLRIEEALGCELKFV